MHFESLRWISVEQNLQSLNRIGDDLWNGGSSGSNKCLVRLSELGQEGGIDGVDLFESDSELSVVISWRIGSWLDTLLVEGDDPVVLSEWQLGLAVGVVSAVESQSILEAVSDWVVWIGSSIIESQIEGFSKEGDWQLALVSSLGSFSSKLCWVNVFVSVWVDVDIIVIDGEVDVTTSRTLLTTVQTGVTTDAGKSHGVHVGKEIDLLALTTASVRSRSDIEKSDALELAFSNLSFELLLLRLKTRKCLLIATVCEKMSVSSIANVDERKRAKRHENSPQRRHERQELDQRP